MGDFMTAPVPRCAEASPSGIAVNVDGAMNAALQRSLAARDTS
jgi:hypothetical protein